MKGKIHNKNGELVVMYKHYSPGRDNYGHEKYSWRTNFYRIHKIDSIDLDLCNYIGMEVSFKRVFHKIDYVDIDFIKLKKEVRDIKINKIINEEKRITNIRSIV